MSDPYRLQRFVDAQQAVYPQVLRELASGRKRTHWMWFIFPQIAGLGRSETAQRYAISSLDEARTYLAHPLLGARLHECAQLVAATRHCSASEIFGYPDDMKFHSSMSLFAQAAPDDQLFDDCLRRFFDGTPDSATLARL